MITCYLIAHQIKDSALLIKFIYELIKFKIWMLWPFILLFWSIHIIKNNLTF